MILLTHWKGRFGNRMFTYLYGLNYARRHNTDFFLPSTWEGNSLFVDRGARVFPDQEFCDRLNNAGKKRMSLEDRSRLVTRYFLQRGEDITYHDPDRPEALAQQSQHVYFEKLCVQNTEIFQRYSMPEIQSIFSWSQEVRESDLFRRMEDRSGSYTVAHLRRGDIANLTLNQCRKTGYSVLSKRSYERAFKKFGIDPSTVVWVTDDRSGKWGISHNRRQPLAWNYPEGSQKIDGYFFDWFEDFLLLYFANTIFRANSSFSWWAACLNRNGTIYSPILTHRKHYLGPDDELDVEFVEGNHPHWLNIQKGRPIDNIHIPD